MFTAPDLAFLAGAGPEEEEEAPLLLDQRLAFFFFVLNLRRFWKLSLAAGVIVTVESAAEGAVDFLSRLSKQPSQNLCRED